MDEPELVKTNGSHLFVAIGGTLRVVSVKGRLRRVADLATRREGERGSLFGVRGWVSFEEDF